MEALDRPKPIRPKRHIRRRPEITPRRPPVTSSTAKLRVYALTVHSRPLIEECRSFWIDGSATFTTVLSSMIMNSAKHIAPRVHQRRFSSVMAERIEVMSGGGGRRGRTRGGFAARG